MKNRKFKLSHLIVAALLLFSNPLHSHDGDSGECVIENSRYIYHESQKMLRFEGTSNCLEGKVGIQFFDGEEYIGNSEIYIENHIFYNFVNNVEPVQNELTFKYHIEKQ